MHLNKSGQIAFRHPVYVSLPSLSVSKFRLQANAMVVAKPYKFIRFLGPSVPQEGSSILKVVLVVLTAAVRSGSYLFRKAWPRTARDTPEGYGEGADTESL